MSNGQTLRVKVASSALVMMMLAGCGSAAARLTSHPSTTGQAPAPPSGPVYVLGDSLTVGMAPYLPALLPGRSVEIDGKTGRTATEGLDILATRKAPLPPTVVMALGTNDIESPEEFTAVINETMARLGPRRVIWVNIAAPRSQPFNVDMDAARTRYRNLEIIDWASVMTAHPEDLVADRIHNTDAGYRLRAEVIAWVLER
jgi:lysophospholipase L1-like esterase